MSFIYRDNINDEFISELKQVYYLTLPDPYVNFLLKYGEFIVTYPNYIEFEVDYLDDSSVSIEKIFGKNIFDVNDEILDEVTDYIDAIIIGSDPGGNYFLLENITGHIMYWDRTWLHNYVGKNFKKEVISYKNDSEDNDEDDGTSIFLLFNSFKELEEKIINSIDIQKSEIERE